MLLTQVCHCNQSGACAIRVENEEEFIRDNHVSIHEGRNIMLNTALEIKHIDLAFKHTVA